MSSLGRMGMEQAESQEEVEKVSHCREKLWGRKITQITTSYPSSSGQQCLAASLKPPLWEEQELSVQLRIFLGCVESIWRSSVMKLRSQIAFKLCHSTNWNVVSNYFFAHTGLEIIFLLLWHKVVFPNWKHTNFIFKMLLCFDHLLSGF